MNISMFGNGSIEGKVCFWNVGIPDFYQTVGLIFLLYSNTSSTVLLANCGKNSTSLDSGQIFDSEAISG